MPSSKYPEVNPNPDFPAIEEKILEFWGKNHIFQKSVDSRPARNGQETNEFIFYDGPPFANGLPHYGHLLTGYVKDLFARYETMKGRRVERRFGWDCHGLPAEMGAEKELSLSGRQAIIQYGIGKFNEHCRTSVMKYTHEWEHYVTRTARWVDFKHDYKTMDISFMESVLWAFKQLYDKGLIYEAYRVMPYSWAAETPLSNFETKLDNSYREREDKAITVAFELNTPPKGAPKADKYYVLAWTTTPWTLPSNLALAVNTEIDYACVLSSPLAGEHDATFRVGGGKTDFATEKAQEMRKEPTDAEKKLWYHLSQNQLGYKFRRQQPIGNYIVDFYNAEKRLVIELDGGQHADNPKDNARTQWLQAQGLKILRFWNNEVLKNIDGVLTIIVETLKNSPHAVSSETAAPPQGGSNSVCYIVSAKALSRYGKELGVSEDQTPQQVRGDTLLGLTYKPLFPYFADRAAKSGSVKGAIFETARLYLRPFTEEDSEQFYKLQSDPDVASTTSDGVLPREKIDAELKRFIACQKEHGYSPWAVFEKGTDKFIGRAGLDERDFGQFDTTGDTLTEVRYTLHKQYWGKGYATELATALTVYAFDRLHVQRVIAGCSEVNPASQRILSKLGFTHHKTVQYKNQPVMYYSTTPDTFKPARNTTNPTQNTTSNAFRILDGSNFVTDADGTGIVHMAPGFGEDDQKVCEEGGIDIVVPVDGQGKFTDEIFDLYSSPLAGEHDATSRVGGGSLLLSLKGLNVIAEPGGSKFGLANDRIIDYLKKTGHLIKQETIKHNYPHCWRTDTPLIYRALPSWYVEVTKFRDRAAELNKTINWIPEHVRDGQMGHMLATAPDWSISRNRFWGTPIPIWKSKSGKIKAFGSIAELEKASGQTVTDLHRPYIDEVVIHENGEEYRRVEDVFDCWFESGSMPFAQVHYPFENKDWFEHHFPADFITEYVGQTRGWFNTLIMLSTALFDKIPFKNCICHGVVLDAETGLKYSKRLKNYKDPLEVINQFGADALRWLMIASPVMRGLDLMVDPEGKFIRDVVRLAIKPIWNAYNFFCLYANADGIKAKFATDSTDVMDRYILAKCRQAIETIRNALDNYDTPSACDAVTQFFEALNNWYIRRNKERFWKTEQDADKQAAYDTLYTVLTTMCQAAAPLLPLTLEEIYKGLTGEVSVHLAEYPSLQAEEDITEQNMMLSLMESVRDICNAALAIRNKTNIRVRQPLKSITAVGNKMNFICENVEFRKIIADEINVKEIISDPRGLKDVADFKISINNPILGKRLPEKMKQIIPASKKGEWEQIDQSRIKICGEIIALGEYTLQLEPKPEYKDRAQALSTNDALVILDTEITPELEAEGIARDLVRMVQQARKDAKLNVSDRIKLHIGAPGKIAGAIATHKNYLMEQTLSVALSDTNLEKPAFSVENMLDDEKVVISLSLAA